MKRRNFLQLTGAAAVATYGLSAAARPPAPTGVNAYRQARRFADLPCGRIAYVERGTGGAALFLHGAPLNGFQWRGALDRLAPYRRCIAPDFMGLGYSEIPERQSVAPAAQVAMLASLLDALHVGQVDIVASDSGGAVAQMFLVRYPARVRTMLLTDCDTEPDSPPPMIKPVLDMANAGTLANDTAKWLTDKNLARATFGAAVYHDPAILTDDVIEYYVTPMVSTPLRRRQYHEFHKALAPNSLAGIEAALKRSTVPVRMVWGAADRIFPVADAAYLDRTFARSLGVRQVPEGKLFFQEEFPDVIAEEARRLWRVG
ncbi:alpha/beta fold hydrolase [Massilia sp. Root335]|uniref:alpha/beta fold hydrolase n=1 Tax=Massilia sp. Root335 TaxID=1736517 RepID=UPI0006FE98CB|nr:alpha/beta hydrolase [Massilia sp. Root335]KQV51460.1 alpha/beta hydrolase [Massilia sp. Root335]